MYLEKLESYEKTYELILKVESFFSKKQLRNSKYREQLFLKKQEYFNIFADNLLKNGDIDSSEADYLKQFFKRDYFYYIRLHRERFNRKLNNMSKLYRFYH